MDPEEEQKSSWAWVEHSATIRILLAPFKWIRDLYYRHVERYHLWDETRYRLYTRLVAAAVGLMVLAALAEAWRLGLYQYRHRQETIAQETAQACMAAGDYHNAALRARLTLARNPDNLPACRIMAELADRAHSPTTLDWLKRIVQIEPTLENQLILALASLNYQKPPYPAALQILHDLPASATNSATYHVVSASLAMRTGHLEEATAHFEAAARLEPTNQLFKFSAAVVQLDSTNRADQVQSRAVLEGSWTQGSLGVLALRALIRDALSNKHAEAALNYSRQLVANPQATLDDQLQNLSILKQQKTDAFPGHLQAMKAQVRTNAPAVAEVSDWMQENGLLAENLDWLTGLPVALLDQQPVQTALAQGYLQSRNWQKLQDIASQGNWGSLEFYRFALAFRAWSQMGDTAVADSNWSAAMAEAAKQHGAMFKLWELAESWHLQHEREDLLTQIVLEFPAEHWAQHKLEQSYFDSGNTMGLNQLYGILNEHFPAETVYKNNLAATALLLKVNLAEAGQWAAEVYTTSPENPSAVATYAFALHLQGRDKQGIAALEKLPPAELAQPSVALYYGVLLAAIGKDDEAMPWLKLAQTKGHLLPEEKVLVETTLAKKRSGEPVAAPPRY